MWDMYLERNRREFRMLEPQLNAMHEVIVAKTKETNDDAILKKFLQEDFAVQLPDENVSHKEKLRDFGISVFTRICAFAFEVDEAAMRRYRGPLFKSKCIDARKRGSYITPAGFFASQGDRKNAERLRNLGASATMIAYGAALGGQREYAEELRIKHGALVHWIASGAVQGKDTEYAEELRTKHGARIINLVVHPDYREEANKLLNEANVLLKTQGSDPVPGIDSVAIKVAAGGDIHYAEWLRRECRATEKSVACGAAAGGHREYLEWLQRTKVVSSDDVARFAIGYVANPRLALHFLSFIDRESFRRSLAMNFKLGFINEKLIKKAESINKLMKRGLNYDEARAWISDPGLQNFMHVSQGDLLECKTPFPPEIHILIGSFLVDLPEEQLAALRKKMIFARNKHCLFRELNQQSKVLFFGVANNLKNDLQKSISSEEVIDSLQKELLKTEPAAKVRSKAYKEYRECMLWHLTRFKLFLNPQLSKEALCLSDASLEEEKERACCKRLSE